MEFFHKNEYVRSYSIYKHDTTLKMTFEANFFWTILIADPLILGTLEWFLIYYKRLFHQTFSPTYQLILLIFPCRNMAIALQSQREEINSI